VCKKGRRPHRLVARKKEPGSPLPKGEELKCTFAGLVLYSGGGGGVRKLAGIVRKKKKVIIFQLIHGRIRKKKKEGGSAPAFPREKEKGLTLERKEESLLRYWRRRTPRPPIQDTRKKEKKVSTGSRSRRTGTSQRGSARQGKGEKKKAIVAYRPRRGRGGGANLSSPISLPEGERKKGKKGPVGKSVPHLKDIGWSGEGGSSKSSVFPLHGKIIARQFQCRKKKKKEGGPEGKSHLY